jgi:hypothetical protein
MLPAKFGSRLSPFEICFSIILLSGERYRLSGLRLEYIYAIYSQWVSDICLPPNLEFLELCITYWHEQVTFSLSILWISRCFMILRMSI